MRTASNNLKRRGMTMVELLIAAMIMTVIMGAIGMTVMSGSRSYEQGMAKADVDAQARRMVERVAREFFDASQGTLVLTPAAAFGGMPDDGNINARFRRAEGFAAGALVLGVPRTVGLQYSTGEIDDGVDNNLNGLVDECRIVLMPDVDGAPGQAIGLGGFVREYLEGETQNDGDDNGNGLSDERGLCMAFDADTNTLMIRVTIERLTSQGRRITSTAETSVRLRNE
jgi:prepilin-type N-terminal cleavage/methylation domain-containing protein